MVLMLTGRRRAHAGALRLILKHGLVTTCLLVGVWKSLKTRAAVNILDLVKAPVPNASLSLCYLLKGAVEAWKTGAE